MFKNCVFKGSVNTKKWLKATGKRMVRTMAQTALALLPATATLQGVSWGTILSTTIYAGVVCLVMCIAGVPEAKAKA